MRGIFLGLTGGIGSGKTTALKIIGELGFKVLSCDEITSYLYSKQRFLKTIKRHFPTAVEGRFRLKLQRVELAKALDSDDNYALLTKITLVPILDETLKRVNKLLKKNNVCLEVPLLFENKLQSLFDKIIVIKREKAVRINSVKTRSNLSDEQVLSRINRQVDYDTLDLSKYIVIQNDGSLDSLKKNVIVAIKQILLNDKSTS